MYGTMVGGIPALHSAPEPVRHTIDICVGPALELSAQPNHRYVDHAKFDDQVPGHAFMHGTMVGGSRESCASSTLPEMTGNTCGQT
jgi:hypothetical protein